MSLLYRIENFEQEKNILIKKSKYISLFSDKTEISRKICEGFYNYFSDKKNMSDKKIIINNNETGEKEQISSKYPIYLYDNDIELEAELGSKTVMYQRIVEYLKEKYPIEPVFLTLNSLMESFFLEETSENLKKDFTTYSEYNMDFDFKDFTTSDLMKKIEVKYLLNSEVKPLEEISNFEKLKLKLSLYEVKNKIEEREKLYIFYYPERLLSIEEIKKLKKLLERLIENNGIVVVATNSKYLLGDTLDSINIIKDKKLLNFEKNDELRELFLENYPELKEWTYIENRLVYFIKNYLVLDGEKLKITNKRKNDLEELFLQSYEDIFILVFYLKNINMSYELDIDYNENCVFSNYINKNF